MVHESRTKIAQSGGLLDELEDLGLMIFYYNCLCETNNNNETK